MPATFGQGILAWRFFMSSGRRRLASETISMPCSTTHCFCQSASKLSSETSRSRVRTSRWHRRCRSGEELGSALTSKYEHGGLFDARPQNAMNAVAGHNVYVPAEYGGGAFFHLHKTEETELAFLIIEKRSTSELGLAVSRAVEPNRYKRSTPRPRNSASCSLNRRMASSRVMQ